MLCVVLGCNAVAFPCVFLPNPMPDVIFLHRLPRLSLVLEFYFFAGLSFFSQIGTIKWKVLNYMYKTEKNTVVALFLKAKS